MEILQTYEHLKITYGELGKMLKKLNFVKKIKDNYIIFINEEADAVIVLVKKPSKTLVYPPNFASASYTVYLHGLTEKKDGLPNMILKERELRRKNKAKAAA